MHGERDGCEQEQNADNDFHEHSGFRLPHTRNALALVGLGLALCGLASFRLLFLNVLLLIDTMLADVAAGLGIISAALVRVELLPALHASNNGSEFADADGIERSARRKDAKRTTVYYCHAYSSCERGTNENINRMIRRQFPKGTDFDKVTAAEVKRVETWLNNYPREILGFMSSAQAFELAFDRAA